MKRDRKTDTRAYRRERPKPSPEVLHGGARVREASGLPEPWQPSLVDGCPEGSGCRDDPLPGQVPTGSAGAAGGGQRREPLGVQIERSAKGLRDPQGPRGEVQRSRTRRGQLRPRGLLHRSGRESPDAAATGPRTAAKGLMPCSGGKNIRRHTSPHAARGSRRTCVPIGGRSAKKPRRNSRIVSSTTKSSFWTTCSSTGSPASRERTAIR